MKRFQEKIGFYLTNHERRQGVSLIAIFLLLLGAGVYCGVVDVVNHYNPIYTGLTFIAAIFCFLSLTAVVLALALNRYSKAFGTIMSWAGVLVGAMTTFCLLIVSHDKIYLLFYLPGAIMAAIILFDLIPGLVVSGSVLLLSVLYLYIPGFNGNNPALDHGFRLTFQIVLVFAVLISFFCVVGRQMIEASVRQYAAKYRELAYKDTLTDLYNHSYYVHYGATIDRHVNYGENLGVLFIDLDGLKKINDQYGHPVGNEALIAVAKAMASCDPTTLIRYAGDEFLVLEPRIEKEALLEEAKRLIAAVEQITLESTPELKLTISIGLYVGKVTRPAHLDEFVKAADKQLYVSKHSGKDTVSAD